MSTEVRTWYADKEHSVADAPSGHVGSGKDDHAPVGSYGSWTWRELIRFANDWTGWTGGRFVSARLKVKTSGTAHLAFGSAPRINVARLTATFDATHSGGGENAWGTGYGTVWPGPSATAGVEPPAFTDAQNTVVTLDISDMFEAFVPSSMSKRDGTPGGGATNHGIRFMSTDESSATHTTEFSSMRGAYRPRVEVTVEMASAPGAPTLGEPTGAKGAAQTTFSITATATPSVYDVQVSDDATFASTLWDGVGLASGISGTAITATYAGGTQPTGVPILWRARTANSLGVYGPWSTPASFSISVAPSATVSGGLVEVWNLGEVAEWADAGSHAKPRVRVAYAHGGGVHGTSIRVSLYTTADVPISDHDFPMDLVPGSVYDCDVDESFVRNTSFKVGVRATAGGLTSAESARVTARMQWGQGLWTTPIGAATNGWRFEHGVTPADASAAFLFRSRGASTGPWKANIGDVDHDVNLDVLVRLSTTGANPALPSMKVLWTSGSADLPSHWGVTGGTLSLDSNFRRFGVKSFGVVSAGGGTCTVAPLEPTLVSKGTKYTWSTYVHTEGNTLPDEVVVLVKDGAGNVLVSDHPVTAMEATPPTDRTRNSSGAAEGWQRLWVTVTTPDDVDHVTPCIVFGGATSQRVHLDGHQLEEGPVASGWRPGMVGQSVVVDVGGIAIDATSGGTFQLQGAAGGPRDRIELGDHGLVMGVGSGPVEVHSPQPNVLHVGATRLVQQAAPATPPAGTGIIYLSTAPGLRILLPDGSDVAIGAPAFSGAKLMRTTAFTVPHNTLTAVVFDTGNAVETYDDGGYHDMATNPSRFTAPKAGKHHVTASYPWAAGTVGYRIVLFRVTDISASTTQQHNRVRDLPLAAGAGNQVSSADVYLDVGDYVEMMVFQDSGADSVSIGPSTVQTLSFDIHYLGA